MGKSLDMKPFTFITPGTPVTFSFGGTVSIEVIVTKVMFEGASESPQYEVAWFGSGQRYFQWVQPFEIKIVGERASSSLGFRVQEPVGKKADGA